MRKPELSVVCPAAVRLADELLRAAGRRVANYLSRAAGKSMITAPVNPAFRDDDSPE
jgi:hypothetical protein